MQVYLDVIWLLNLLFDSLLLYITGVILKRDLSKWKIALGGLIGSLLVFAPFIVLAEIFLSPFFKIFVSMIMVVTSFGFKRWRYFIMNLSIFYLCTFTAGGALIGIHYLLRFNTDAQNTIFLANIQGFGDPISWIFIFLGFPIVLYLSKESFDQFETVKIQSDQIVKVTIQVNKQTVQLKGLIDSGNQLYDPLSKRPVMIASLQKTNHLFPKELLELFENVNSLGNLNTARLEDWMSKISIIPYKVVGQDHRLIAAIKPDHIFIEKEADMYQSKQVLVAFVNQSLSSEGAFDCILHPKMMAQAAAKNIS